MCESTEASRYLGLVEGTRTRTVYTVLSPDTDADLDDPDLLEKQKKPEHEPVHLVKIERGDYRGVLSQDDIDTIVRTYYATTALANDPYDCEEYIGT